MTTALFSNIEKTLLANIKTTTDNIKVAVAWFTNPKFYYALSDLVDTGKTVQLILADDIINFRNKNICFQSFIEKGIEIRISRFPHLMHHKFCIIDERLIISGSYNWTKSAEINNHENIILSNELNLVSLFNDEFNSLKKVTEKLFSISTTQFNSYFSEIETLEEIQLATDGNVLQSEKNVIELENIQLEEISGEVEIDLDKANLLYLKGKHQDVIDICLEIVKIYPTSAEAYELIASSKWRQGKYKEQIKYAEKAIESDNQYYPAYNILGIGYSHIRNSQKSIENYQICIKAEPEQYVYCRNRALSYLDLKNDSSVPKNLRDQFAKKADSDFNTVIEVTNRLEKVDNSYTLYFSRGIALLNLNKLYPAKVDLL